MIGEALTSPAASRNLPPLIEALAPRLPAEGSVLELASGPGQHAVALAERFPTLTWQPSDVDPRALASIEAWRGSAALANLKAPRALDLAAADWWREIETAPDAALALNVTHIAPWPVTENLLTGLAHLMPVGASFFLYGPFLQEGVETAPSNLAFDRSLRAQNPAWGLRSAEALDGVARAGGLAPVERVAMPANNLLLVFRRLAG